MTGHLSNLASRYDPSCSTLGQVVKFQHHEKCILFGDTEKSISTVLTLRQGFAFSLMFHFKDM